MLEFLYGLRMIARIVCIVFPVIFSIGVSFDAIFIGVGVCFVLYLLISGFLCLFMKPVKKELTAREYDLAQLKTQNKKSKKAVILLVLIAVVVAGIMRVTNSGEAEPLTTTSSSSGGSYSRGVTGAGGYDMPNSSDKSFADYVQRVDPDLYNSMKDRYESLY